MPLAEKKLIAEIRRRANVHSKVLLAGIGDDCAVLHEQPGYELLVTTDFSLEGTHFRRDWHPAESVGHRCLARGLSDIAAMGGEPVSAFLSLALPRDLPQRWVTKFIKGFLRLAEKYQTPLAGGDTAQSVGGILADIIVVGRVPKGKAVLRSGARPGDRIYVSGKLGGSAAAVHLFLSQQSETGGPAPKGPTIRDYPRHFYPDPRVALGRELRKRRLATSMIDLSDGLSTDLEHICKESGAGAAIEAARIPRAKVGRPSREVDLPLALNGGEDYELLFTARAKTRIPAELAGVPLTEIGRITNAQKVVIIDDRGNERELRAQGWEHFR